MPGTSGPADTMTYFIAGYVVFFIVVVGYLVSLALRQRNLRQDLETYKEIAEKEKK